MSNKKIRGIESEDQRGFGTPYHVAQLGTRYFDSINKLSYINTDGVNTWELISSNNDELLTQTIVNGDTTHAPSSDIVFDKLQLKQNLPTGYVTGLELSIHPTDNTKAIINIGTYIITDFTDLTNIEPTIINVTTPIEFTPAYLTTSPSTYIALDINKNIISSTLPFDNESRRTLCLIGNVVHSNLINVNVVNEIKAPIVAPTNQLHDLIKAVGFLNLDGNLISPNGANLSLNKSAGRIWGLGINGGNFLDPHRLTLPSQIGLTFRYRLSVSPLIEYTNTTVLDPTHYEPNGNGILTPLSNNNRWSIQHLNIFQSGIVRIQYGQHEYGSFVDARNAAFTESFITEQNISDNAIFRCYIIMKKTCTNLQQDILNGEAEIIHIGKFGNAVGGSLAALTLANIISVLGYTPENQANKSDSYTTSSSVTYASSKALVDGLATKQNILTNPITGTGTTNLLSKFTSSGIIGNSQIFDNGTNIGIGTTSPSEKLDINGNVKASGFKIPNGTENQTLTANGGVFDLNTKADLVGGKVPKAQSQPSTMLMDGSTYVITFTDATGAVQMIDLPIESLFQDANYDETTKSLIVTLQDGTIKTIPLTDLVDLPEIVLATSNPTVTPTSGQKVYFNTSLGKVWFNVGGAWVFGGNLISDSEKTSFTTAYHHSQATGNPHNTTKSDIGLGSVDNTSDLNKPVSNATQTALDNKQDRLQDVTTNIGVGKSDASATEKLEVNGYVKASGFKISSGTSSQFLMADGTVNSNTYALTSHTHSEDEIKIIVGTSFASVGQYQRQFNQAVEDWKGSIQTQIDNKANSSDVYKKNETYSKIEINNLLDSIEVTKSELDILISENNLEPNRLYKITGVEGWCISQHLIKAIYLKSITNNTLDSEGVGEFYTPKYNNSDSNLGIWKGELLANGMISSASYNIGDKVIWGNLFWENISGSIGNNIGSKVGSFVQVKVENHLSETDWQLITPNNNENLYNIQFDRIKYDIENDYINFRADDFGNVYELSYNTLFSLFPLVNSVNVYYVNGISLFQWGISNTSSNTINESLVFNCNHNLISFKNNHILKKSTIIRNSFLNVNIEGNTLKTSYVTNNFLKTYGGIFYNNLDNSYISLNKYYFEISYNNLKYNSRIYTNNDNNIIVNDKYSIIKGNTLDNNSTISYNIFVEEGEEVDGNIKSIQGNELINNCSINNNTIKNGSKISDHHLSYSSTINGNTLDRESNIYNNQVTQKSKIDNNILTGHGRIFANQLDDASEITLCKLRIYPTTSYPSEIHGSRLFLGKIQNVDFGDIINPEGTNPNDPNFRGNTLSTCIIENGSVIKDLTFPTGGKFIQFVKMNGFSEFKNITVNDSIRNVDFINTIFNEASDYSKLIEGSGYQTDGFTKTYIDGVLLQDKFDEKQDVLTNPVTGTGTTNLLPKFTSSGIIGNSQIFDNGTSVGVGTTTPIAKLDVDGDIVLRTGIITGEFGSYTTLPLSHAIKLGISGRDYMDFYEYGGVFNFYQNTGTPSLLMTIKPVGVGIGATSPSEKLDVNGNIKANSYKFNLPSSVTAQPNTLIPSTDGTRPIWFNNNSVANDLAFKSDVDNIQIGGRNLLLGSKIWKNIELRTVGSIVDGNLKIIENYYSNVYTTQTISVTEAGYYTISFTCLEIASTENFYIEFKNSNTGAGINYKLIHVGKNIFTTYLEPGNYYAYSIYGSTQTPNTDKYILISNDVKLEKGNKATDWTPAPEDKVDSLENVNGLGFVLGSSDNDPYIKHANNATIALARKDWSENTFFKHRVQATIGTTSFVDSFLQNVFGTTDAVANFKLLRTTSVAPPQLLDNFSSGIAFKGSDTHGALTVAYNIPKARLAGGNGNNLNWYADIVLTEGDIDIYGIKTFKQRTIFNGGNGNGFSTTALEIQGNGSTIKPGISFHQPEIAGAVLNIDNSGNFHFKNPDDSGYQQVYANSFIKSGGTSEQFLKADGSVSLLTNNITGTGTINYLTKFSENGTISDSQIFEDGTYVRIKKQLITGYGLTNVDNFISIANTGVGYATGFRFDKTNDGAGLSVTETVSDSTMYEFFMSDNPDGGDMMQMRFTDWQSANTLTVPFWTSGKTNRFIANYHDFYGPIHQITNGIFTTSNFGEQNGSQNQLQINQTSKLRLVGSSVNITDLNINDYDGDHNGPIWIKLDSATTFAWGTGHHTNTAVQANIPLSTSAITLSNGIKVTFSATTGDVGDLFTFRAIGKPTNYFGTTNFDGNITATSFIKSGGTSEQFLKADGSVDNKSFTEAIYTTNTPISKTGTWMSMTDLAGIPGWTHVINLAWEKNNTDKNWSAQIAVNTQFDSGMYYRSSNGEENITNKSWKKLAESSDGVMSNNYYPYWNDTTKRFENGKIIGVNGIVYVNAVSPTTDAAFVVNGGADTSEVSVRTDTANPIITFNRWTGVNGLYDKWYIGQGNFIENGFNFSAADLVFAKGESTNLGDNSVKTPMFFIQNNGNTGIGITNRLATEKLDVNGNIKSNSYKFNLPSSITAQPNMLISKTDGSRPIWYDNSSVANDLAFKSDVDNIQIGGRNLFGFNKGINFLINTIDKSINGYICNYASDNLLGRILNLGLEGIGGDFVVSLYIKANKNVNVNVNLCDVSTSNSNVSLTTDFVKYIFYFKNVYQYTGPDMFGFLDIECSDISAKVFVKDLKIEKGNKATDWTPAPEDKQDRLQDITGNIGVGKPDASATAKLDVNGSGYYSSDVNIGGGLIINGSLNSGSSNYAGYRQDGDNIILKGNSTGVSGIFFQSEKDGTNINHPSDYGYIQFHAYGIDGTSGESNRLVIGVANDGDDMVVLQSPYMNGVKISCMNGTSGTGGTEYTVWHQGNGGSGSGLDADLLDGQDSTYFLNTSATMQTKSGSLALTGTLTATSFFESSLRKYKTNIKKFDKSGIDLVDSLEIVTFDRIDSDVKSKIGIIADDTSDEFLSEQKDAIDLYKTIFIQSKAIQELNAKNLELEERLIKLEKLLSNG